MLPWTAECEVAPELALDLIREQFPELGARRVERLGVGWDNSAFLVDDAWVFRFPRRQVAVALLEAEARVLPGLAPRLPLLVPNPVWLGKPSERYPWPFSGYRYLAGRTACGVALSGAEQRAAARALGEFVAALHRAPVDAGSLPGDALQRTEFVRRLPPLDERLAALEQAGLVDDAARWRRLFDGPLPGPPTATVVVHGDLYARHILVNGARAVSGVLDWGDVHAGDPATDLSLAYGFLPASLRDEFFARYGAADDRTHRAARLRAAFHAVSVTWYAHSVGDNALTRAGLAALRNVLDA